MKKFLISGCMLTLLSCMDPEDHANKTTSDSTTDTYNEEMPLNTPPGGISDTSAANRADTSFFDSTNN